MIEQAREALGNREAKTQTALVDAVVEVEPAEFLEDFLLLRWRDPGPVSQTSMRKSVLPMRRAPISTRPSRV